MYSLGTNKISSTEIVYLLMNFVRFNAHTTPLVKNVYILKFSDIKNVESYIFINNCFNKDSLLISNENFK